MRVRWTLKARNSLLDSTEYIRKANPEAATRVITKIHQTVSNLPQTPYLAPSSLDFPGYRELYISNYPFVIWYRVKDTEQIVEVSFVWHTAQNRSKLV
jgi:toxin ParE1/3/4